MSAKCGPRVVHHWSHLGRRNCDPWWENETEWHRRWKNCFPAECREISHTAPDGEVHRADVKSPTGIYLEIQHSAMTDAERSSREAFYQNLIWVVDGRPFRQNFDIYHMLPDPHSELGKDLKWVKARRQLKATISGAFYRISTNRKFDPGVTKTTLRSGLIESMHKIEGEVKAVYRGHRQYDWIRPRKTWLDAGCPVYVDFGEAWLARLEVYDETELRCVRLLTKNKFIRDVMTETYTGDVGKRLAPMSMHATSSVSHQPLEQHAISMRGSPHR